MCQFPMKGREGGRGWEGKGREGRGREGKEREGKESVGGSYNIGT